MFPNEQYVKRIKKRYPVGARIVLESMDDPQAVPSGTNGIVQFVGDIGSLHCHWDNGRSLAVIPGKDSFRIIVGHNRDDAVR